MSLERESRSWRPRKLTIAVGSVLGRVLESATGIEAFRRSIRQKQDWVVVTTASIGQIALPLLEQRDINNIQDGKVPIFGNSVQSRILKTLVEVGVNASIMIIIVADDSRLAQMFGAKAVYNVGIAVLSEVINIKKRKSNKSVTNK